MLHSTAHTTPPDLVVVAKGMSLITLMRKLYKRNAGMTASGLFVVQMCIAVFQHSQIYALQPLASTVVSLVRFNTFMVAKY